MGKSWDTHHQDEDTQRCYALAEACLGAGLHPLQEVGADASAAWWHEWIQIQIERMLFHYWRADVGAMASLVDTTEEPVTRHGTPSQRKQFYQMRARTSFRRERFALSDETVGFAHAAHEHEAALEPIATDAQSFEDQKVASAIKTDFILSAEIMTITLRAVPDAGPWTQAVVLAVVGIAITVAVYGVVAIIVKADDVGLALAQVGGRFGAPARLFGRALVRFMPWFLRVLGTVGTAAMIWVGGGILLHGLESYGWSWPSHLLHDAGAAAAQSAPAIGAFLAWLVQAAGSGVVGLCVGLLAIPIMSRFLSPLWRTVKGRFRRLRGRT
jgi:hypothetical protein